MKRTVKWAFVPVLTCASLLMLRTACAEKVLQTGILKGTVSDSTTGKPVAAVIVRWATDCVHTMTASSDMRGRFALRVPIEEIPGDDETEGQPHEGEDHRRHGDHVVLTFERNGYEPKHYEVQLSPCSNPPLTSVLEPQQEFATVKGQVTGPNGQGIPNASVSLLFRGFPQPELSTMTDDQGHYVISHVGYGKLALQVILSGSCPACVKPSTRAIDAHEPVVNANVSIATASALASRCPPVENGDLGSGISEESPPPTIYTGAPLTLKGNPQNLMGNPTLSKDTSIQWMPVSVDGILSDADRNIWNSGHVNDLLKIGPAQMLVASDNSGVWSIAWSSVSAAAIPLSTTWLSLGMSSLAQGPDGSAHVYAGTSSDGVLWETDTSSAAPLVNWIQDNPKPPCNSINHILVIPEGRLIVLACDTGVFWSAIPAAPAAHGTYNWQMAQPAVSPIPSPNPVQRDFSRLAKGPGWERGRGFGSIVASVWGGAAPDDLIFWGTWINGQLVLNFAHVAQGPGNLFLSIGRTTVASCPANLQTMYAMGDLPTGNAGTEDLAAVWKSVDGGKNWNMVNLPPNATGHQGEYNQALAVSPVDCNTVAIGWSYSSFVSFDGGNSYPMALNGAITACGSSGCNLHDDYHALLFDPNDASTLWFGSDGGVASASGISSGGTPNFASYYNQHLADLEFYHASPSRQSNLIAGPLQDNAVVYSVAPAAWQRVPGSSGDGAYSEFTGAPPSDVLIWNSPGDLWQKSPWTGTVFGGNATVPVVNSSNGINGSVNWNVRHPSYINGADELMYAVAGLNSNVYGLFAQTDGSDMHWEGIGSVGAGENVTAVSSADGTVVFVGTDQGNICQLTAPYTGSCSYFAVNQSPASSITGVIEFFSAIGMATTASGHVLALTDQTWNVSDGALPTNQAFVSVEGPDLASEFVTNSQQVFVTHDLGSTWLDASQGLPARAQGNELHFDGNGNMCLSTYGWSMFRAPLGSSK